MDKIIVNQSIQHLLKDKKIKTLINKYSIPQFFPNNNYFDALSKTIIYQQLSGKVAKIIYRRFILLFKNEIPSPKQYMNIETKDLKNIGLSKQKIKYINNLSEFFIDKDSSIQFKTISDNQIYKELICIKGIGRWSIDMFMMFTLCKPDILPVGDLGIKKAFKTLFNLKELPSESFMQQKALKWKPYRTIASCYLWMEVDDSDVW